jgi:hypothetical protein
MGDLVFFIALAVMVVLNLYFAPRIEGDRIAMQWTFGGTPTWYASKFAAMWGPVAFAVIVRLVIWAAQTYTPDLVHGVDIGLVLFSVINAAVHAVTLKVASR